MLFLSTLLLALNAAGVALAAAVPETSAFDLETRQDRQLFIVLYKDIDWRGESRTISLPSAPTCFNVPNDFNDQVSSVIIRDDSNCFIYPDANCKGNAKLIVGATDVENYKNFNRINFNDVMSSYLCGFKKN